jgi:two-component system, cell cycle response regulator
VAEQIHILVIEDDDVSRTLLHRLLTRRFSCKVHEARNGREGLDVIRGLRPDLVLLDVMLPELDGMGVLQAMRSDPECAPLPVVIISSAADREAVMKMVGLGIRDYLLKPFKADLVTRRIGKILTEVQKSRQAGTAGRPRHSRKTQGKAS